MPVLWEVDLMERAELLKTAREIYEKTQCAGVGCCGDIDGALEYIDGAISELVAETHRTLVNKVIARIDGLPDHPWIPGIEFNDGELMKTLTERI